MLKAVPRLDRSVCTLGPRLRKFSVGIGDFRTLVQQIYCFCDQSAGRKLTLSDMSSLGQ